jgi:hypothetical protein
MRRKAKSVAKRGPLECDPVNIGLRESASAGPFATKAFRSATLL